MPKTPQQRMIDLINSGDPASLEFLTEVGLRVFDKGDISQTMHPLAAFNRQQFLQEGLLKKAFGFDEEFNQRQDEQESFLTGEFDAFNQDFDAQEERLSRLFRSQAADQVGAQAKQGFRNLRGLIGRRGLNPNSGTAAALANRVMNQQSAQMTSARRDIALDSARRRTQHRSQRLAGAFNLGDFRTRERSMVGMDVLAGITQAATAETQNLRGMSAADRARKDARRGAMIGGAFNLAGAFL